MSRSRVFFVVLLFAALLSPATASQASSSLLCSGYGSCSRAGYSHAGYETNQRYSYWRMYTGTNCTNYVAYRLVKTNGLPNTRPKPGVGNARDWGVAMSSVTDRTPTVGSVAWWGRPSGGNHVAYVERVVSSSEIVVSESNWGRNFDWRRITKSGSGWPDGFIHFSDPRFTSTAKPTLSGTPKVGVTLKASTGSWSPSATTHRYTWYADNEVVSGAKYSVFTPTAAEQGKNIKVKVTAVRDGYPPASSYSTATGDVAEGTLAWTTKPEVDGTPRVDATLTAVPGGWRPAADPVSYRWMADGRTIAGATGPRYVVAPEVAGRQVSVAITVGRDGYKDWTSTSPRTTAVAPGTLRSTTAPTVTGTPRVDATLTASRGTWSRPDVTPSWQWLVDGVAVEGATGPTYRPAPRDVGKRITARVTATRDGYLARTVTTTATAPVAKGTLAATRKPAVPAAPRVGEPLTGDAGTWTPEASHTYQWFADGRAVTGAKSLDLTPPASLLGKRLQLVVWARRAGYTPTHVRSVESAPVAPGRFTAARPASVSGSPLVGRTLTLDRGDVTPAGTRRVQWLRDGRAVPGATGSTYRLTKADLRARISARLADHATGYTTLHRTVPVPGTVRSGSTLVVSPRTSAGKAVFWLRVDAPHATPTGRVSVTIDGTMRTALLSERRASITMTGLPRGTHTVRVAYAGSSTVASAVVTRTVTVP